MAAIKLFLGLLAATTAVYSASIGDSDSVAIGDILFTKEQYNDYLTNNLDSKDILWKRQNPDDEKVYIPFKIYERSVNRRLLDLACDAWEKQTCVDFYDMEEYEENIVEHLKVVTSEGCLAGLGRHEGQTTLVSLGGSDCVFVGLMHEFGHALGLVHEQSRSDRDEHLIIVRKNIAPGDEPQFEASKSLNFNVPYDYMSAMQYSDRAGGAKNKRVMLAKDARFQNIFGDFKNPSFQNFKLINTVYGCIERWHKRCKKSDADCKNGGYVNSDCGCSCPAGTKGKQCEKLVSSYNDALIEQLAPHTATFNTAGAVVATPGYPKGPSKGMRMIQVLEAPKCQRAVLTFEGFKIDNRNNGNCPFDSLEIRSDINDDEGKFYCSEEIKAGQVFKSTKNILVLHFKNYDYANDGYDNPNKGYKGKLTFEPIAGW